MLRRIHASLICVCAALSSVRASDTVGTITVLIFNDAGLPHSDVHEGTRQANAIYARAGIETVFLDCAPTPSQAPQYPGCQVPITANTLIIHIVSNTMAERLRLEPEVLGSALFPEDGSFGRTAMVCGEKAAYLAHGPGSRRRVGTLLGALITHEVGHLLLGPGSHSPSGIMHSPWTTQEITSFTGGSMEFTPEQASLVRRQVHNRMAAASPVAEVAQRVNDVSEPPF